MMVQMLWDPAILEGDLVEIPSFQPGPTRIVAAFWDNKLAGGSQEVPRAYYLPDFQILKFTL